MESGKSDLVDLLAQGCGSMKDINSLLKELYKVTIEEMLEAEMDEN